MNLFLPLKDVTLCQSDKTLRVKDPSKTADNWQVSQHEFAMQVEGVADFYVRGGNYVEYSPLEGADPEWIKLCLNGRVMAALLHQRKIINFHASSFIHNGLGTMILGETGAGKSSLTASFALSGAGFLSDDLTPVILRKSIPYLRPLSGSIKISENTIGQLKINKKKLTAAESGTGKQYFHIDQFYVKDHVLHTVLKIEIGKNNTPEFYRPEPAEKFSLLRSEICSSELLAGMPETETEYLHQLLQIVQQVNFVRVVRPAEIGIQVLHAAIDEYLNISE
jgi:hypothetical protein